VIVSLAVLVFSEKTEKFIESIAPAFRWIDQNLLYHPPVRARDLIVARERIERKKLEEEEQRKLHSGSDKQ
jgi:hypothetical protein